ncbi:cyclic nucleotide-binding protein [Hymenobacter psoromatis]|nr:cyclic nucleotide-binding protein [Hymenobacter psoromatis]
MDEFLAYLLQFGSLNQRQQDLIASKATTLALPKDGYLLEAGQVARQVAFVLEGVIRICYYDNKGHEITRNFIEEHRLATDLRGLEYGLVSAEYLQAATDCRLLVFAKRDWDELAHTIVGWNDSMNRITAQHLREKLARISPMVAQDATTRYLEFIENYPRLANRIPLSHLASFLGITQSSLSRIRKNIR